jgi:ectoine hydroxylase-related dioxygenase (phytanoyl-CoA dioxygenase family)
MKVRYKLGYFLNAIFVAITRVHVSGKMPYETVCRQNTNYDCEDVCRKCRTILSAEDSNARHKVLKITECLQNDARYTMSDIVGIDVISLLLVRV